MTAHLHLTFSARSLVGGAVAVGALAFSALLLVPDAGDDAGPTDAPEEKHRRVAIRVDCTAPASCALAESLALDVWSEHRGADLPLDVVVPASALAELNAASVPYVVIEPDIDAAARAEAARIQLAGAATSAEDWFAEFRDYAAISAKLEELAVLAPDRASLHGIGSSLDGRPLWALRVGGASDDATPMLINGTQHAREWIAAMTTTCIADRLVREYDNDETIKEFVDTTELWIVPVVNPDGYQYSWGQDRYWRKNRRDGHGVDLNRNFAVGWGGSGSSGLKRSETYRGPQAFSEVESIALRDLVKREGIKVHIDYHAYGQLVLYPWNHSSRRTDDHARFAALGDGIASAIYAEHGERYRLMRGVELYPAAGTMTDWMYGEAGALSFTIELRPKGRGGFVLPPEEIRPTCDEGLAALLALRRGVR